MSGSTKQGQLQGWKKTYVLGKSFLGFWVFSFFSFSVNV